MRKTNLRTTIGTISGTSMDGIDVALLETDGETIVRAGAGAMYPYPPSLRRALQAILSDPEAARTAPLEALEADVTDAFSVAIRQFATEQKLSLGDVDLIGFHGQTILHRPEEHFTRQLGMGQRMADDLCVPVVDGFRMADVASGGQGAPLVPLYHQALVHGLDQPVMILNLGGVGNVTYVDGETVIAFDTGPASALIDDLVLKRFGIPFDEDGAIAARGHVDVAILKALMANPFFAKPVPKSLDRQEFHARATMVDSLSDDDAVATLAAFTVAATVASLAHVPVEPKRWLVCGGGRKNLSFMRGLAASLQVPVEPVEAVGWNGDLIEAQCFGYLAVRSNRGLPLSLPSTTGVPHALTGGQLWRPRRS